MAHHKSRKRARLWGLYGHGSSEMWPVYSGSCLPSAWTSHRASSLRGRSRGQPSPEPGLTGALRSPSGLEVLRTGQDQHDLVMSTACAGAQGQQGRELSWTLLTLEVRTPGQVLPAVSARPRVHQPRHPPCCSLPSGDVCWRGQPPRSPPSAQFLPPCC